MAKKAANACSGHHLALEVIGAFNMIRKITIIKKFEKEKQSKG